MREIVAVGGWKKAENRWLGRSGKTSSATEGKRGEGPVENGNEWGEGDSRGGEKTRSRN